MMTIINEWTALIPWILKQNFLKFWRKFIAHPETSKKLAEEVDYDEDGEEIEQWLIDNNLAKKKSEPVITLLNLKNFWRKKNNYDNFWEDLKKGKIDEEYFDALGGQMIFQEASIWLEKFCREFKEEKQSVPQSTPSISKSKRNKKNNQNQGNPLPNGNNNLNDNSNDSNGNNQSLSNIFGAKNGFFARKLFVNENGNLAKQLERYKIEGDGLKTHDFQAWKADNADLIARIDNPLSEESFQQSKNDHADLSIQLTNKELGREQYGKVYKGIWHGQPVAVKKIPAIYLQDIDKEIKTLKMLEDDNIIKYYGEKSKDDNILLIMEFAEHGSLNKRIERNKNNPHDWQLNYNFIDQMTLKD